ncbi:cytochrome C [Pseudoflavitalea sp. X16]|uniref:c-type cytochrome n=1 Tax=Paraflavitalea devenefica TaxID=2716334 RepID=UPI00141E92A6|nr:c-type cytochrome [Paraflavitalea devenefica]NII25966.1 cytochrome C [Paraflavitalea devenefica]
MKIVAGTLILLMFIMAVNGKSIRQQQVCNITAMQTDTTPVHAKQAKAPKKNSARKTEAIVKADSATISEGLELIGTSDCTTCHKVEENFIGPSYKAIAGKYKPTQANISLLVKRTIEGGSGVWGPVPMTPHPDLSAADAKKMMQCILSMK